MLYSEVNNTYNLAFSAFMNEKIYPIFEELFIFRFSSNFTLHWKASNSKEVVVGFWPATYKLFNAVEWAMHKY